MTSHAPAAVLRTRLEALRAVSAARYAAHGIAFDAHRANPSPATLEALRAATNALGIASCAVEEVEEALERAEIREAAPVCAPLWLDLVRHTDINARCIADLLVLHELNGKPAPVLACLSPGFDRRLPSHPEAPAARALVPSERASLQDALLASTTPATDATVDGWAREDALLHQLRVVNASRREEILNAGRRS